MTITTRTEVIVTCENTPLMELLEHIGRYVQLGMETQPRLLTEPAQVKRLAPGTIIKDADGKLHYSCGKWWASLGSIYRGIVNEVLATSIQLPAAVVFTPEVQA